MKGKERTRIKNEENEGRGIGKGEKRKKGKERTRIKNEENEEREIGHQVGIKSQAQ